MSSGCPGDDNYIEKHFYQKISIFYLKKGGLGSDLAGRWGSLTHRIVRRAPMWRKTRWRRRRRNTQRRSIRKKKSK